MSRKLTLEEKIARKKDREQTKKFDRQLKWGAAIIFLFVALIGTYKINHISTDTALIDGFLGGMGYMLLVDLEKN